jgi:hypothetical protein
MSQPPKKKELFKVRKADTAAMIFAVGAVIVILCWMFNLTP